MRPVGAAALVAALSIASPPSALAVRLLRSGASQEPEEAEQSAEQAADSSAEQVADSSGKSDKSSKGKGNKIRFKLLDNIERGSCLPFDATWSQVRCKDFGWKKAKKPRRVFDAFAYNGEIDIAEARRRELAHVINGTAVAITSLNFKGQHRDPPPPPEGENVRHWLLPPESFDKCWNENRTMDRECACSMAKNSAADAVDKFDPDPDDWVIFGDPDEIPDREAVRLLSQCDIPVGPDHSREVLHFSMSHHYYFDLRCTTNRSKWEYLNHKTPAAVKVATMREYGLRVLQAARAPACVRIGTYNSCSIHLRHKSAFFPCAAWHLSSFGGLERLHNKSRDNADLGGHVHLEQFENCTVGHPRRTLAETAPKMYPEVPHAVEEDPARFQVFFQAQAR